jgi:hypothetical protein
MCTKNRSSHVVNSDLDLMGTTVKTFNVAFSLLPLVGCSGQNYRPIFDIADDPNAYRLEVDYDECGFLAKQTGGGDRAYRKCLKQRGHPVQSGIAAENNASSTSIAHSDNIDNTNNGWVIAGALVSGTMQELLTPGNDAAKVGAGLMTGSQSMLSSATNPSVTNSEGSAQDPLGDTERGITYCHGKPLPAGQTCNYGSSAPNSSSLLSGSTKSGCLSNLSYLSGNMPAFSDPMLKNSRQFILNYTMATVVSDAKSRGWSRDQAASMALQQADKFEDTAQQNAKAGSGVSTYLTPKAIVMGANSGRLPLSLPCSGSISMVEAAECEVIRDVWQSMLFREIARQIPMCW